MKLCKVYNINLCLLNIKNVFDFGLQAFDYKLFGLKHNLLV